MIPCFSGLSIVLRGSMRGVLMHDNFEHYLSIVLRKDTNVVSQKIDLCGEQIESHLNRLQRSGKHGKRTISYVEVPFPL